MYFLLYTNKIQLNDRIYKNNEDISLYHSSVIQYNDLWISKYLVSTCMLVYIEAWPTTR